MDMFVVGIALTVDVGRKSLLCVWGYHFIGWALNCFKSERKYKHPSSKDAFILFVLDWGCEVTTPCFAFPQTIDYILVNK